MIDLLECLRTDGLNARTQSRLRCRLIPSQLAKPPIRLRVAQVKLKLAIAEPVELFHDQRSQHLGRAQPLGAALLNIACQPRSDQILPDQYRCRRIRVE
jgi:hypothetical protein